VELACAFGPIGFTSKFPEQWRVDSRTPRNGNRDQDSQLRKRAQRGRDALRQIPLLLVRTSGAQVAGGAA
jgi:hypothetical protein